MIILVPTDFSALSKVAVMYARQLAQQLNAEIKLLHVVSNDAPAKTMVAFKEEKLLSAMADNAGNDMEQMIMEIQSEARNETKITSEIVKGYPFEDVVSDFAINNHVDLIVIGTKGASGIQQVLIGSNAVGLISESKVPVIVVPELATFKTVSNIVYATDMLSIGEEMKQLIPFAKVFDATIHILHIIPPYTEKDIYKSQIKKDFIAKCNYNRITAHVSLNENLTQGIDEYILETKADMLAMFTHELSFFEKLFGKSITRKMAFHTSVPLLTIKK